MKNKNLKSLLQTVANQQEENAAEFENLGQELAAKLKGGSEAAVDDEITINFSCPQNTGCK
ncbi:hypothetical protein [Hymenobacter persicinus]|uniref:Uncharacterized protein n=1 Tax=Hymenobacter persicinus TaxID=2025506 RepID=A0A4Q5LA12_9BACT|nr:hypothetical protein [Hymenobacter persicinus]RYU77661.1 hypothetical protein EWM57_17195 [Hymenobacter persicinus]RYU77662.1 hypothetical protein EWM57_17200 [Hymenobacter persicinus]RYU77914.1 hypothetical protein EWM57_16010 [Hymenobacter persicinus]RYU77915.1 hypothetical protein EWM57_16015 [Hymenobacter persicinus]